MTTLGAGDVTPRELRKFLREHPWKPGLSGKAVVSPLGTVTAWDANAQLGDVEDGYIHHGDVMQLLAIPGNRWGSHSGALRITRDGEPVDTFLNDSQLARVNKWLANASA
jgi:hypothetical protein